MDRRQKEAIEAYGRVQAFLAGHPLEAPATYGAPQRMLDEVIVRLAGHTVMQNEGARQYGAGTRQLAALFRELRDRHLRPIAAIARAAMRTTPGIELALRIPGGGVSATRLVAEAQAVRNAVASHEASFVENGRPADFIVQLDAAIAALQECIVARGGRRGDRVASGKALREEIRIGRNAVEMLDAAVRAHFANDTFALAKWRHARRVVKAPAGASPAEAEPSLRAA